MSGPLVREILAERKTMTRRPVKDAWKPGIDRHWMACVPARAESVCPYGVPGDRLWVRETHVHFEEERAGDRGEVFLRPARTYYRADGEIPDCRVCWTPSIHMPRGLSRLTLDVLAVRVERLQEITEEDARAEGVTPFPYDPEGDCWTDGTYRTAFQFKWNEIYGWHPDAWEANPWVWVISFRRAEG